MNRLMLSCCGLALALLACDERECIIGPSNLTAEMVAACEPAGPGTSPESRITSAGAEFREGVLFLTLSNIGLECGVEANHVELPTDCAMHGWVFTLEIPEELAVPGVIHLAEHPEVRGTATVLAGYEGGRSGSLGAEPFFVGSVELVAVGDACITGILRAFGTGNPDPTLGGPELDGSFVAPRC